MSVTVRRMGNRIKLDATWNGLTQLTILGICFAVGAFLGFFLSGLNGGDPELLDYLLRYFQAAGQGNDLEFSLLSSIWDLVRWPLAVFLFGGAALGIVGIPILLGARGFLLAYAAASFARLFGLPGMAASLVSFGVTALIGVPVLFVVAADAFHQSLGRLSGERAPAWGQRIQALSPCAGLLVLAVALQRTLMPALLTAVCAHLF